MGTDLTLIPFDAWESGSCYANSCLELSKRRDLWGVIRELPSAEIPFPITVMRYLDGASLPEDSDGCDHITRDAYDEPLCYVLAETLLTLAENTELIDAPENRAAWAYLAYLPGETKIALFWW